MNASTKTSQLIALITLLLLVINPMASFKFAFQLSTSLLLSLMIILLSLAKANSRSKWLEEGNGGTTWAVLVAGSTDYENYRHQADICHAYQILKRGGLKDENIIVFMYDDIANHPDNPRPGIIINHPNGTDVYAGVPKDYTGENATTENLYNVILGNREGLQGGSGKVVDSKPEDRIFIYYADHGGSGVLEMPSGPDLYADEFKDVLERKHDAGTYKEMVIYIEACESGSIFEGLLAKDLNIYAMTASNAYESSYGTYCPGYSPAPPHEYKVCLGDLFSVSWLEDSDTHDLKKETLGQQYSNVKKRTYNHHHDDSSHVMEYGTKSLKSERLYLYQGFSATNTSAEVPHFNNQVMTGIDQREADLIYLKEKYNRLTDGSEEKAQLLTRITDITNHRAHLASSVDKIGSLLFGQENGKSTLGYIRDQGVAVVDDWGCLKSTVRAFETHCGILTSSGLKYMRAFANVCNNGVTTSAIEEAIKEACKGYNLGQWNPANRGYRA